MRRADRRPPGPRGRRKELAMKRRILVLDDEMDFADVMKMTLQMTGQYEVRTTVRSSTFLQVAQDFRPHLILLDCMMPGLDGGEVAAQIQADPVLKDTPFMFLTATADQPETKPSVCHAGEQTYLPKTMELDELFKFIEAKLATHAPHLPPGADPVAAPVATPVATP
jgi:two-component system OmpR family response regulator